MSVGENYSRRRRVHALAGEPVWLELVAWLAVALVSHSADLPAELAAGAPLAARLFPCAGGTVLVQLLTMGAHTPVEKKQTLIKLQLAMLLPVTPRGGMASMTALVQG